MREITLGGQPVTIAASPITLYIYTREFGPKADLISDLMSFSGSMEEGRFLSLYKMLWAMAKTAKLGALFPGFEEWMITHQDDLDLGDKAVWGVVLEEATRGLFRSAAAAAAARRAAAQQS